MATSSNDYVMNSAYATQMQQALQAPLVYPDGALGSGGWSTTTNTPYGYVYMDPCMQATLTKPPKQAERNTMLQNVKGYVEKHKDMLFTLGLVILVDHFLFKGALRERIKSTVEGALKKVENSFHKEA